MKIAAQTCSNSNTLVLAMGSCPDLDIDRIEHYQLSEAQIETHKGSRMSIADSGAGPFSARDVADMQIGATTAGGRRHPGQPSVPASGIHVLKHGSGLYQLVEIRQETQDHSFVRSISYLFCLSPGLIWAGFIMRSSGIASIYRYITPHAARIMGPWPRVARLRVRAPPDPCTPWPWIRSRSIALYRSQCTSGAVRLHSF